MLISSLCSLESEFRSEWFTGLKSLLDKPIRQAQP